MKHCIVEYHLINLLYDSFQKNRLKLKRFLECCFDMKRAFDENAIEFETDMWNSDDTDDVEENLSISSSGIGHDFPISFCPFCRGRIFFKRMSVLYEDEVKETFTATRSKHTLYTEKEFKEKQEKETSELLQELAYADIPDDDVDDPEMHFP